MCGNENVNLHHSNEFQRMVNRKVNTRPVQQLIKDPGVSNNFESEKCSELVSEQHLSNVIVNC